MKKLILAFLLLLSMQSAQAAQKYHFQHIGTSNGLPNNTVMCCMQDKLGIIWIGTRDGTALFDGINFVDFTGEDPDKIFTGKIFCLFQDSQERIWVSSASGIGYFDPHTNLVTNIKEKFANAYYSIIEDGQGNIWLSSTSSILRYGRNGEIEEAYLDIKQSSQSLVVDKNDPEKIWVASTGGSLRHYDVTNFKYEEISLFNMEEHDYPVRIIGYKDSSYLIATNRNKILEFNPVTGRKKILTENENIFNLSFLYYDQDENNILVGTQEGLTVLDEYGSVKEVIREDSRFELSNSNVTCIYRDVAGNVWVGTFHGGLNLSKNQGETITQYIPSNQPNSLSGKVIRAITEDSYGNIWVGTEDGFLSKIDYSGKRIYNLTERNGLEKYNYQYFLPLGDKIWAGTYGNGIIVLDRRSGTVKNEFRLRTNCCICLSRMADGNVLAGTIFGLVKLNEKGETIANYPELHGMFIHCVLQDSQKNIWVGVFGGGVWKCEAGRDVFKKVDLDIEGIDQESLYVTSISEDRSGDIWVCTEGYGIIKLPVREPEKAYIISKKEGLPSNIACASIQDRNGYIWVSTSRGIACLSKNSRKVESTFIDHFVDISSSFCYNSAYQSEKGLIYLGSHGEMVSFDPLDLNSQINSTSLYITSVQTGSGDNTIYYTEPGHSSITSEEVRISKKNAGRLTVTFSAISKDWSRDIIYDCTLKKGNNVIKNTSSLNYAVYDNLKCGKYSFTVKVAGDETENIEKRLIIKIIPPFFWSTTAKLFYILILLGIIAAITLQIIQDKKSRAAIERSRIDAQKQQEIFEAKTTFFTNITHEIRTPLTLIKFPIDKIIKDKSYTKESEEDIFTIKANTDRLLELTNQYLDLKKIQDNAVSITRSYVNVCTCIEKTCNYFKSTAKERGISYTIDIPHKAEFISTDSDKVEKILANLLSNAIKYSKSLMAVHVDYDKEDSKYIIKVKSDGDKISVENSSRIFEPFYQIKTVNSKIICNSGTGIGLPYAQNLAKALGGDLYLESDESDLNTFVFILPGKIVSQTGEIKTTEEQPEDHTATNTYTVLFVDDSDEMCKYVSKELSDKYQIICAGNGEEAVTKLHDEKIDIVVSDIMMPVMDGCELCNYIKNNIEFCHIPVILLTAAIGVDTRIASLEIGADGYIEKPFEIGLLKANISNLFKNREIAYRQFTESPLTHFSSTVVNNNLDKQFMDKLHSIVMENLSDENLSSEKLSDLICTSKSTLYRKVKANTGQNINEYVRLCRLKKAAEMLSSQQYRINEVAYLCGFASASYFATCFLKQFNISPSNFVKGLQNKGSNI